MSTGMIASLASYALLGRSGLRVAPLCLGTMTFGNDWGWGADADTARAVYQRYIEAGGNFVDTADGYANGRSEELLGQFMAEAGHRDAMVVATKFTLSGRSGDPNAGGNGRKNIHRALDASLRRLRTDYVDLYWLHSWDGMTPVEEVLDTLDDLVRAGKIRYTGLSDTPAWYLTRYQTLAEARGHARACPLQLEYSLVERAIEREHIPAALELGLGVCPWSPLASGFLSGKYDRRGGAGRLSVMEGSHIAMFDKRTDRNFQILEALLAVARELDRPPAQVAINWITRRPGVASTVIGATRLDQLDANLDALSFDIPSALATQLEEASRPLSIFPYDMFSDPALRLGLAGGTVVHREQPWYRG